MAAHPPSQIVCDVGALAPDAVAIDTLARLQLEARRFGAEIRLRNVSTELEELIALAGLRDVLRLEAEGQAEEREERRGVEEERELDDPAG
jgi:anti-anti-sigma regulatory factor